LLPVDILEPGVLLNLISTFRSASNSVSRLKKIDIKDLYLQLSKEVMCKGPQVQVKN
jgi:hypothetical protein